ncbi:MAG: hypothetical protein A2W52_00675 [Candidatus Taylorbacteria bacterium RIFCSPHIGHO2_02_49_25]|uniref:Uncharacterized protein n=1 Tax=Candidatus Taylorbacteria bacterium RIFCSPHIGHO2_02_49_25 TaxID=1802305 RepID=A0A1G2MBF4_9BACT|nr:MAG: hypothetical protein UY62_C0028G0017 [Parcubacteria group bacterium GW2011_GWF2_50_9]OHA20121.1 MAG: hypothetical protein A2759_03050 [Candidatus Taylorbacteria bacterium RIFCSPHIGHO2_01_FULL_49_60]OHA21143.1 MAG: hypothetical protein A2W52_00675 [Candidatus Taylorbacteria bacterium RIFCSPHIGHO2_02_49_25]OHA36049.1 MAG: hypothetical protein A3B27_01635 [Candidatus Taylorbacteria bacterium RIFCSPLOWO2_01_FULL_50_130]OHA37587.1 MAG: hypothetical protein A2W65_02035 [Candidatus Taylorbacte
MNNHWSVNTTELQKDPESFAIWKLEQWVNWGIGTVRAKRADLLKYWDVLDIDEWKRKALSLALF